MTRRRQLAVLVFAVAGAMGALIGGVGTAAAATYQVDTIADDPALTTCGGAPGDCSLRGAIRKANGTAGGPHVIQVPAGTYTLAIGIGHNNEDQAEIGDLDLTASMTIVGAGALTTIVEASPTFQPSSTSLDRVFDVRAGTATLSGLTIRHGITQMGIEDHLGGGVQVARGATAVLTDVHVTRNAAFRGGGIYSYGTLILRRSTISANEASGGAGVEINTQVAFDTLPGSGALTNVTISGNIAKEGGSGLAIGSQTSATINNSTIALNHSNAELVAGSFYNGNADGTTVILANSIVAGNTKGPGNILDNCFGPVTSAGYNLSDTQGDCPFTATGDQLGANPRLEALAVNGGQTPTHALLPGSDAVEAGSPAAPGSGGSACAATDQRGLGRPQDAPGPDPSACDIGAYEKPGLLMVDRTDDVGPFVACTPAPNDCDLRGAVLIAGASDGSQVRLPAGTYTLTRAGAGEDNGFTGDLDVGSAITEIIGAGAATTIIQAGPAPGAGIDRIFDVHSGNFDLFGVTVRHGTVGASADGGGIRVGAGAFARLTNVVITRNRADFGGGISNRGGIDVSRATISANEAVTSTGGGVYSLGRAAMRATTVHGNSAGAGASGIYQSTATMSLNNLTIVGNTTAANGLNYGAGLMSDSNVRIANSIVAGNRVGSVLVNCGYGFNFGALLTSDGYNLADSNECPFTADGDTRNQDPRLGPLQNNGGQTQTLMPLAGSPAVDTANPVISDSPTVTCELGDQYNVFRLVDGDADGVGRCDKGAVEAPACTNARPPIQVATVVSSPGVLTVTVRAGLGTLSQLQFRGAPSGQVPSPNALLTIGGQPFSTTGTYVPPSPTSSIQFTLQRAGSSGSVTLPFTGTDGCGSMAKFVGGGPGVWGAGVASSGATGSPGVLSPAAPGPATPSPTPTPTETPRLKPDTPPVR